MAKLPALLCSRGAVHPLALHQAPNLMRRQSEPLGCTPLWQQIFDRGLDDLQPVNALARAGC